MTPLKIAVAQIDIAAGKPAQNAAKIIDEIVKARLAGDDLIVFPEMAVPGYLLGDEWENEAFIKDCFSYNEDIKNATQNIIAIWGNVDIDTTQKNEDGRIRKFNAAFIAQNGKWLNKNVTHKTLMPKYREFDDERHFYSLRKTAQDKNCSVDSLLNLFEVKNGNSTLKLGVILCEDMWNMDYTINPIDILLGKDADMIVNLSCSPWTWRKNNKRHRVVLDHIRKHPVYFVYANNTGIQNNGKNIFLFDGNSTIYNPNGTLLEVANNYCEQTIKATLFDSNNSNQQEIPITSDTVDNTELFEGIVYGIKKFFEPFSSKRVAIGLSGGIDSALSAVLLTEALGAENVFAINMPSQYNSQTTQNAAFQLATNLGINYSVVPIQHVYEHTIEQLETTTFKQLNCSKNVTKIKLTGLNKENIQARDRGSRILAGMASALNALFVNNGNKTETALGYATLYGDVNGALAPIADLYKTEVYELARYYNRLKGTEIIPRTIFDIPASAELSYDQNVDEGKGDPIIYPYHDKLVRAFIEFRLDPEDILRYYQTGTLGKHLHCDQKLIDELFPDKKLFIDDLEHKWRLFKISIFKRIQCPPIITVSKRAFGYDLRESQNGIYYTREYLRQKELLLRL